MRIKGVLEGGEVPPLPKLYKRINDIGPNANSKAITTMAATSSSCQ